MSTSSTTFAFCRWAKKIALFLVKSATDIVKNGAGNRIRIGDLLLGKQMLYQLSYSRTEAKDITTIDRGCQIRMSFLLQRLAVLIWICYRNGAHTHTRTKMRGQIVYVDQLKKIPLFGDLTSKELERIGTICQEEKFPRGEHVFEEKDEGDKIYIITDGEVRISKFVPGIGEEALAILKAGDFFGEMSLIDDEARSATVIAHEDCVLLSIEQKKFEEFLFLDKELAYTVLWGFVRTLNKRLRETNDKIKAFFAMSGGFS